MSPEEAEMRARAKRLAQEIARRRALTSPASFIPQEPTPRQAEFLALDCFEALYGGAAGGGKSSALLMAAAQYVHVPGYAALLLRRTYADLALPGAIMDRSKEWWHGKASWSDKDKRWTFPSGATITFGYLDTDRDRYRYQGAELQFIAVDELTQLPKEWYTYLLSRLRRLHGSGIPLRARAASNPGGIGHDWVRRRFVEANDPTRTFVPATLEDNPYLDAQAYRGSLAQLDTTTRRQLLNGIWVPDTNILVYKFDETKNQVATTPLCTSSLLALDFGYTDATAFTVYGWRDHDPNAYVLRSWKETGLTPSDVGEKVAALEKDYRFERIVGDLGGLGKGYAEEARKRFSLPIEPADKQNKRGYISLMNGALERGEIKLVKGQCDALVSEWLELPWTEDRSKESAGFDNHCADSALYGWRATTAFLAEPAPSAHVPDTAAAWEAEEAQAMEDRIQELGRAQKEWWDV